MSATIDIQSLTPEDHDLWLGLWRGYQTFYRTTIAPAVTEANWRRLLDPAEPMHGALAWIERRPLGLVHFIRHRSTWTDGDYVYLQDLFVAEEARGRGLGRRLIAHVVDEARASGAARVYWLTHETNDEARALYDRVAERSGFIQYRILL